MNIGELYNPKFTVITLGFLICVQICRCLLNMFANDGGLVLRGDARVEKLASCFYGDTCVRVYEHVMYL